MKILAGKDARALNKKKEKNNKLMYNRSHYGFELHIKFIQINRTSGLTRLL